jgi:acyl dehydratase
MLTLSIASGLALRAKGLPPFEILAFLGTEDVKLSAPVFVGDTIWVEVEVVEARPSKSRPNSIILKFKNTVKNQRDEVVASWNSILMAKQ